MNNIRSNFNKLNNKLYINDGKNYLTYNGDAVKKIENDNPYIPRTSISRKAGGKGGGELLEDVNVLQPKRINSFVGDGTSKEYYLDAQNIDNSTVVATL